MLGDVTGFLARIFHELERLGISVDAYEIDHICYRVSTMADYDRMKARLDGHATLLIEASIQGRLIASYELHDPIVFRGRRISVLELPQPKPGKPTPEGLEHAEFVIDESLEDFVQRYPLVDFDWSGRHKVHNPEIELSFGDIAVKFHTKSLKAQITEAQ